MIDQEWKRKRVGDILGTFSETWEVFEQTIPPTIFVKTPQKIHTELQHEIWGSATWYGGPCHAHFQDMDGKTYAKLIDERIGK